MAKMLAVACFVATAAAGLSAEQTPVNPSANAQLGALRTPEQANAYRKLFEARESLGKALEQQTKAVTPAPKKKVVCGMTVIEMGPEIDPKMALTPPKDDSVKYTIRAIDPPICNPAR